MKLRRFARTWLCAALALALAAPLARAQLPTLGDGSEMNSAAERKLGERIAREIYRDPDYIDDAIITDYVQTVWQPLLAAARARGELSAELDERFAWEIMLDRDRTINAFALPGGYLGMNLGLLGAVANRDEMASVLAHELSHVTQRHISRLMTQQSRQTPWMLAAMVLGALAASRNPEAANAMVAGGQALAAQNGLNFSRDMEREADRVGYGVMTQAGFDPQGFVTMFDKLQQASRLNDNGAFPYLRTHPMTTERIADMQARQQLGTRAGAPAAPTMEHAMMSARARVMANPGVDALRAMVNEAEAAALARQGPARQAGALYGAALASFRLRDNAATARYMARLGLATTADAAGARQTRLLNAEIALQSGDPQRAASLLEAGTPAGSATGRPELMLSSQAAIATGRAGDAAQKLQGWVALHPRDGAVWQLLGSAYGAEGQGLRAIRAEAEAQVARLDYAAALDRFKAAQDLVRRSGAGGDHIEASIIDTRTRQVESLLREQAVER